MKKKLKLMHLFLNFWTFYELETLTNKSPRQMKLIDDTIFKFCSHQKLIYRLQIAAEVYFW